MSEVNVSINERNILSQIYDLGSLGDDYLSGNRNRHGVILIGKYRGNWLRILIGGYSCNRVAARERWSGWSVEFLAPLVTLSASLELQRVGISPC
jgi:hypothetical protein